MLLNYGHTLAHALEAAGFADARRRWHLRHGEAVAVGLVFAALLARRLGRIDDERVALHRRVVAGFDLPADLPAGADAEALVAAMGRDKKARHDLTFVLDGPTGVETVRGVEPADVAGYPGGDGGDGRERAGDGGAAVGSQPRSARASANPRSTARPRWPTTWPRPPRPASGLASRSSTSSPTTRAASSRPSTAPGAGRPPSW